MSGPAARAPAAGGSDAILALGGGVSDQGRLPETPRRRVELAVALLKRGVAPRIIFSGWYGLMLETVPERSEAAAMADYARELGVSPHAILVEDVSRDTIGNAYFAAERFLKPHGWTRLRIVTSDFHVPRAAWVFAKILGPAYDVAFSPLVSGLSPVELAAHAREEAVITAFLASWLRDVPDGDEAAVARFIAADHPGYARNPTMSLGEMRARLEHLRRRLADDSAGGG